MQRSWEVEPDSLAKLDDGSTVPTISQQALAKNLCDLAIMLDRAGGCGNIVLMRHRTLVPNEAVTTKAYVLWQDRTDAKAQPERIAAPEPVAAAVAPSNGEANGAVAADLPLIAEPQTEAGEAYNEAVQKAGDNPPPMQPNEPLPPPPLPPQPNEARIMTAEETAVQARYDAAVQRGGQDEVEVDESDIPPRLRG